MIPAVSGRLEGGNRFEIDGLSILSIARSTVMLITFAVCGRLLLTTLASGSFTNLTALASSSLDGCWASAKRYARGSVDRRRTIACVCHGKPIFARKLACCPKVTHTKGAGSGFTES